MIESKKQKIPIRKGYIIAIIIAMSVNMIFNFVNFMLIGNIAAAMWVGIAAILFVLHIRSQVVMLKTLDRILAIIGGQVDLSTPDHKPIKSPFFEKL